MAYGYSNPTVKPPLSGTTNPAVQSVGNQPGGAVRTNTGAPQPTQSAPGVAPQFGSTTGSAVSPTGQISQTPAGAPPDPFTAMGGGVYVNGGWVPKDHPLAQQAQGTVGAVGAPAGGPASTMPGAYTPQNALMSPYGAYPATYSWQGSPVMDQMQSAVMNALGTPLFDANSIAQMKGAAKDQSATALRDQNTQLAQNNASRGTSGSGQQAADERRLATAYNQTNTDNNRQIDLGTTQANRADMYQALGAGGAFTGQDEGLNQAAVASALGGFFQNRGLDIQKLLGLEGISAEREGNKLQAGTSVLGSLLGYQNNNNQIGLGYSQLDAQQQNALLARLLGGF